MSTQIREKRTYAPQQNTAAQVLDIARETGRVGLKEPAEVCAPEALEHSENASAAVVRGMGVAGPVAVLMMAAVHGHPLEQ
jgi:hypothetical protein